MPGTVPAGEGRRGRGGPASETLAGPALKATLIDLDAAAVLAHEPVMGVHDLGAEELLGALLFMGALPRRVRVVGIQPAAITLGTELSPEVAAAVPGLLDAVVGYLAPWQAQDGATADA